MYKRRNRGMAKRSFDIPNTYAVYHLSEFLIHNGDGEIRTLDPLLARQVLSQLSYTPITGLKWTRTIDLTLIRRAL